MATSECRVEVLYHVSHALASRLTIGFHYTIVVLHGYGLSLNFLVRFMIKSYAMYPFPVEDYCDQTSPYAD